MRPMHKTLVALGVLLVVALVSGCGGSALQTAATNIAALRGCDATELTVLECDGTYEAVGCAEPAVYRCTAQECAAADGEASEVAARARSAEDAVASVEGLDADVMACANGEPVTAQISFGADGRTSGLQLAPDPGGDARRCVGLLLLEVQIGSGAPLLWSRRFGGPVSETAVAAPEGVSAEADYSTEAPEGDETESTEGTETEASEQDDDDIVETVPTE